MGKTRVSEKDGPDLERLEAIVRAAGHEGISTAALSEQSGIAAARIRKLLNEHFSRVERKIDTQSKRGISADLWVYRPTPDDISALHRAGQ